jgi:Cof subfamily protein (haloacid dehalogenase superfamily)
LPISSKKRGRDTHDVPYATDHGDRRRADRSDTRGAPTRGRIHESVHDHVIRLLAVDIDGTLLDSCGRLPDAHRAALADAAAAGIEVALATGRSFHFAMPVVHLLALPVTLIVNNGALVKNSTGATAMRHLLPREVARRVLAETHVYEDSVAVVFDRPDERQVVFERMDWSHPNRAAYYEKNRAFIAEAPASLTEALTEDPIQVMFNGGVAPMRALARVLRTSGRSDEYTVAITEYAQRDFSMVDVNGAGCSKGATLARWADARGVASTEVMAVGDNLNDVEMLDFAGTAVVMGNAADAIKQRGYLVTGTNDEEGLARAIRAHALVQTHRTPGTQR